MSSQLVIDTEHDESSSERKRCQTEVGFAKKPLAVDQEDKTGRETTKRVRADGSGEFMMSQQMASSTKSQKKQYNVVFSPAVKQFSMLSSTSFLKDLR